MKKSPLTVFDEIVEDVVQLARTGNPQLEPPTGCQFYRLSDGFCQITGGPCPHFQSTFERCLVRSEYNPKNPLILPPDDAD